MASYVRPLVEALRQIRGNELHPPGDDCPLAQHVHPDNRRFPLCDDCLGQDKNRDIASAALATREKRHGQS